MHAKVSVSTAGPGRPSTTAWLIDGLRAGGVEGLTVLDIGAGVGAVHHELLPSGASAATDVDGSPAYVAVAREERRGAGRRTGSATRSATSSRCADRIEAADIVALDRVVCCYPDMEALVSLSVAHARRRYGLVFPRDTWWTGRGSRFSTASAGSLVRQVRTYIHRTAAVDAIVASCRLLAAPPALELVLAGLRLRSPPGLTRAECLSCG